MRGMERWLAAVVALGSGCQGDGRAVPPIPDGTKAALWAFATDGQWRIEAADLVVDEGWQFSQTLPRGTPLAVLTYEASLFNLNMQPGPVERFDGGRLLPEPDSVATGEVTGDESVDWRVEGGVPRGLAEFRIAPLDPQACIDAGGCVGDGTSTWRCERPCPFAPAALPTPPAPPVLTPCPTGWRASIVDGDDVSVCRPAGAGAGACGPGLYRPPGAHECVEIGQACAQTFAIPPAGRPAMYVDTTAEPGGTGSIDAPLRTISAAIAATGGPVAILVAAGTYSAPFDLRDGVIVVGACATEVRLGGVSLAAEAQAELRNLSVGGALSVSRGTLLLGGVDVEPPPSSAMTALVTVSGTGRVELVGGRVSSTQTAVSVADDGVVNLRDQVVDAPVGVAGAGRSAVTLSGVRFRSGDPALIAGGAAQMSGSAVVIEGGVSGIQVDGTAEVRLEGVVIRNLSGHPAVSNIGGLTALSRLEIYDVAGTVVRVAGGLVRFEDGFVHDIQPDEQGSGGWAVAATDSGGFAGRRLKVARIHHVGVEAIGRTAVVQLEDTIIEDVPTAPSGNGRPGGANAREGGSLVFDRVVLRRVVRHGIATEADFDAAQIDAQNLVIEDVRARPDGSRGQGIVVDDGTELTLTNAAIRRTSLAGIDIRDGGTRAELTNVVVEDIRQATCLSDDCVFGNGVGILVFESGQMDLRQFAVRGAAQVGLRFAATLGVTVRDGVISGSEVGLWASDDMLPLERLVERVVFEGNEANVRTRP